MKIYLPHSKQLEFKPLYSAIRNSSVLAQHQWVFPYENTSIPTDSKQVINSVDLLLAEVSYPGTGLGIELGWADFMKKKIICIYKENSIPARSLASISQNFISYKTIPDLITQLEKEI